MKVTVKAALAVALGATAAYGGMNAQRAEAATLSNIIFNADLIGGTQTGSVNDFSISGTAVGDVDETTGVVSNLTNVMASLINDATGGEVSPLTLTPGSIPQLTLTSLLDGTASPSGGSAFLDFVGTGTIVAQINTGATTFARTPSGEQSTDFTLFDATATPVPTTSVPTPALLPGLMLMSGAIRRRLKQQGEMA